MSEEGGWKPPDPGDPNPTYQGVTQRVYDGHRDSLGLPRQSVALMTAEERGEIYDSYWIAGRCGDIASYSSELSVVHFDTVFNGGGAVVLQRAVGVKDDGVIGPVTLAAVKAACAADAAATVNKYLEQRLLRFESLTGWAAWGHIWVNRENALAALVGSPWRAIV